jgi:hypothetical protein
MHQHHQHLLMLGPVREVLKPARLCAADQNSTMQQERWL